MRYTANMNDHHSSLAMPVAPEADSPSWTEYAESTPDVAEFCRVHDLSASLTRCFELIRKSFRLVAKPSIYLSTDPETAEKWAVISVMASGALENVSDAYDRFIHDWVRNSDRK